MSDAVLLEGVTKTFGKHTAVDTLDLAVPQGSIYGFIGPNGSGKTTTLRMILRIFRPDSGRVFVLGREHSHSADEKLGYLPEERGLYKRMVVRSLLQYYARLKGHYDCDADIDMWLEKLGADDWADRKVDALSKGMAQKVQFISAVVARPELVILDEPFSGLDPVNMESLRDAVIGLRESGTTVIFSTHDMEMAEELCDTIFMIFRGRKVLDGSLTDIQQNYAVNQLRVRLAGGRVPNELVGARSIVQQRDGFSVELHEGTDPQQILSTLVNEGGVEHFECVRPSLHDIFVSIARPHEVEDQEQAEV